MVAIPPVLTPTVVTGWDVEEAVIETLKPRMEFYTQQLGYSPPRAYTRKTEWDKWPEEQLPALVVICGGLADPPIMRGDKTWMGRWALAVVAMVSARKEEETRKMSKVWGALIRATLLQEASLHGFASGLSWVDETYVNFPAINQRSLGTAEVVFAIDVENVVDGRELPKIDGWPYHPTGLEVLSHEEAVQLVPLDEEVTP